MKVIGVTGGIASGKSLISDWFLKSQIQVVDADKVYKSQMKDNQDLFNEVKSFFNLEVNDPNDLYKQLRRIVFNDKEKLQALNQITHPYVIEKMDELIVKYRDQGEKYLVLDVPLLYEAKMEDICDVVICVYLDKESQIQRLMKRDRIDYGSALKRVESQMDLDIKKEKADFVIDNAYSKDHSYQQFRQILAQING